MQNYRQVISRLGEDSSTGNFPQDVGSQALLVDELEQVASPMSRNTPPDRSPRFATL